MNELRFGRLSDEHQSEKTFQQGEETFGRASGEPRRRDAGTDALRSDGDFGCWQIARLIEDRSFLVERGAGKDQPLGSLGLRFRVGWGRILSAFVLLLGLLLIELPEAFVVMGSRVLKSTVIPILQHVEPEDLGLILQIEVVRFDELDQRQLAGRRNKCYHQCVLLAGE